MKNELDPGILMFYRYLISHKYIILIRDYYQQIKALIFNRSKHFNQMLAVLLLFSTHSSLWSIYWCYSRIHSFIHRTSIHLSYARECAVEALGMRNTICDPRGYGSRWRLWVLSASVCISGASFFLRNLRTCSLTCIWGWFCPCASLWSPVDVVGAMPKATLSALIWVLSLSNIQKTPCQLWVIIFLQINILITSRFLLISHLI